MYFMINTYIEVDAGESQSVGQVTKRLTQKQAYDTTVHVSDEVTRNIGKT